MRWPLAGWAGSARPWQALRLRDMSKRMSSSRLRTIATALLAAAATSCGGSDAADKRAFDQRHAACDALLGNGRTLRQAVSDLAPVGIFRGSTCTSKLVRVPGGRPDQCQYSSGLVCQAFFEWSAVDSSLCGNFGCVYFCEVRTMQSAGTIVDGLSDAPVCATDWESGQPTF